MIVWIMEYDYMVYGLWLHRLWIMIVWAFDYDYIGYGL